MKIDINKKYQTRDGRKVKIYAVYALQPFNGIHGAIREFKDGTWVPKDWTSCGIYNPHEGCSGMDLVEVPKTEVSYYNVYFNLELGTRHKSKESAEKALCSDGVIALLKLVKTGDKLIAEIVET